MIYLGADHAGFKLKEKIRRYLTDLKIEHQDLGSLVLDPKDDYPDYALAVANKVAETNEKGIIICGTGVGSAVAANKVKGIRAALVFNKRMAEQSRAHLDSNVLVLGAWIVPTRLIRKIVKVWIETPFSKDERHLRRIEKINRI